MNNRFLWLIFLGGNTILNLKTTEEKKIVRNGTFSLSSLDLVSAKLSEKIIIFAERILMPTSDHYLKAPLA